MRYFAGVDVGGTNTKISMELVNKIAIDRKFFRIS